MRKTITESKALVEIPKFKMEAVRVTIEGVSQVLTNRFGETSLQGLIDKQLGKAKIKDPPRDPERCFRESQHIVVTDPSTGQTASCLPLNAIRNAAITAGQRYADEAKTVLRGIFAIADEYIPILSPDDPSGFAQPKMRTDWVRHGGMTKVTSVAYRAAFLPPWSARFDVHYCVNFISVDQVVNLLAMAGTFVGIGAWRVENNGTYGRFRIDEKTGVEALKWQ